MNSAPIIFQRKAQQPFAAAAGPKGLIHELHHYYIVGR